MRARIAALGGRRRDGLRRGRLLHGDLPRVVMVVVGTGCVARCGRFLEGRCGLGMRCPLAGDRLRGGRRAGGGRRRRRRLRRRSDDLGRRLRLGDLGRDRRRPRDRLRAAEQLHADDSHRDDRKPHPDAEERDPAPRRRVKRSRRGNDGRLQIGRHRHRGDDRVRVGVGQVGHGRRDRGRRGRRHLRRLRIGIRNERRHHCQGGRVARRRRPASDRSRLRSRAAGPPPAGAASEAISARAQAWAAAGPAPARASVFDSASPRPARPPGERKVRGPAPARRASGQTPPRRCPGRAEPVPAPVPSGCAPAARESAREPEPTKAQPARLTPAPASRRTATPGVRPLPPPSCGSGSASPVGRAESAPPPSIPRSGRARRRRTDTSSLRDRAPGALRQRALAAWANFHAHGAGFPPRRARPARATPARADCAPSYVCVFLHVVPAPASNSNTVTRIF